MMSAAMQSDIEDPEFLGRKPQPRTAGMAVKAGALSAAMTRASGAVGRGGTVPILACVLLHVTGSVLTIEATNMELAIRQEIAITGAGSYLGCVNAAMLTSVAARMPEDADVSLTFTSGALTLQSGRSKVTLTMLPPDEFPAFSGGHFATRFTLPCIDLGAMLERVKPFMSTEVSRQFLCGVFLSAVDGVLRFTGTNGNDLCVTELPLPEGAAEMPSIIIPAPSAAEMIKMSSSTGSMTIGLSETRMSCEMPSISMVTKLIDSTYPDCQRIIPKANTNILRVQRAEMMRALGLTGLISDGPTPWVRLAMSKDGVTLSSGMGTDAIVCELTDGTFEYEGEDLSMAYWNRSLLEPVKLTGKTVEMLFQADKPFLARDADDHSATYVAMSIRR